MFFFFNDTATTEIYTLSLHDALPISVLEPRACARGLGTRLTPGARPGSTVLDLLVLHVLRHVDQHRPRPPLDRDRKSTRLNSSHSQISYAGFCLRKKKITLHCHRELV